MFISQEPGQVIPKWHVFFFGLSSERAYVPLGIYCCPPFKFLGDEEFGN